MRRLLARLQWVWWTVRPPRPPAVDERPAGDEQFARWRDQAREDRAERGQR